MTVLLPMPRKEGERKKCPDHVRLVVACPALEDVTRKRAIDGRLLTGLCMAGTSNSLSQAKADRIPGFHVRLVVACPALEDVTRKRDIDGRLLEKESTRGKSECTFKDDGEAEGKPGEGGGTMNVIFLTPLKESKE